MAFTQAQLDAEINTNLPTNGHEQITAAILRGVLTDMVSATFNPGQTVTITPAAGLNKAINITQSVSGTTATFISLNEILINGDTAAAITAGGEIVGLYVPYLFGGGDQGARTTLSVEARRTAASDPSNVLYQDVAFNASFNGESNNNGTSLTPKGAGYGGYFSAQLFNNATYWSILSAFELDIGVQAGSSTNYLIGFRISHAPYHAVPGTSYDTAMDFVDDATTTAGWSALITSSNVGGNYPLASTGTFIRTLGSQTFANGIDFSSATITGNFLKGPTSSFLVDGTGNVTAAGVVTCGPAKTAALTDDSLTLRTVLTLLRDTNTGAVTLQSNSGDIILNPASGYVSYGTYTGTPGSITGYITIKDSGGNLRKIAVTS